GGMATPESVTSASLRAAVGLLPNSPDSPARESSTVITHHHRHSPGYRQRVPPQPSSVTSWVQRERPDTMLSVGRYQCCIMQVAHVHATVPKRQTVVILR